jgi:hypothetical protein
MKKSIFIGIIAVVATAQSCAQKAETPVAVTNAFLAKFPNAKNVKWDKENETEWEAEFKLNGVDYSANFSTDGTWNETEHEIKKSEIPEIVMATINSEYAGYKIEEMEISETEKESVYEFAIEKGESDWEIAIDANGKVTKKEENHDKD